MRFSQGAGGRIGGCRRELVQSLSTTWALTLTRDHLSDHAVSRALGTSDGMEWSC